MTIYTEDEVNALAEVITDAAGAGIKAGHWTLARFILDRGYRAPAAATPAVLVPARPEGCDGCEHHSDMIRRPGEDIPTYLARRSLPAGGTTTVQWAAKVTRLSGGVWYSIGTEREHAELIVEGINVHVASLNEPTRREKDVDKAELVCRDVTTWETGPIRRVEWEWRTPPEVDRG